jgi:hypothetical protein
MGGAFLDSDKKSTLTPFIDPIYRSHAALALHVDVAWAHEQRRL